MALEPITRQEKIIAGQDLTPITRMEKFLKEYGGSGGSGGGSGGVTTLHINVTAVNTEAGLVTASTADKTPEEMQQASPNGPIWCVVTFAAGVLTEEAFSTGIPPAYSGGDVAFGMMVATGPGTDGTNSVIYAVTPGDTINPWYIDLMAFGS